MQKDFKKLLLAFRPQWSELIKVFNAYQATKFGTFLLAIYGFIVALRVRLIDTGASVKLIQIDQLSLACILLAVASIIWIVGGLLSHVLAPSQIRDSLNYWVYMDLMKKGVLNDDAWASSFQSHAENWEDTNISGGSRYLVLALLGSAILLYAGSALFLYLSVDGFVHHFFAPPPS